MLADDRRREPAVVATITLLGVIVLAIGTPFTLYIGSTALITTLLALSCGVAYRAGLPSLAQVALMAVGSWVTLDLVLSRGFGVIPAALAGALAAALVGLILIVAAARLRGLYLLIATLAFAVALLNVIRVVGFAGAADGLFLPRPNAVLDDRAFYTVCLGVVLAVLVGLALLGRTRLGIAWVAVGASERAVAAAGFRVATTRATCFVACAFTAGLAGALLVVQQGIVDDSSFSVISALVTFSTAIMVGAHRPDGAVLAGVLAVAFPELFARLGLPQDIGTLLFAVGAVQAMAGGGGGASEAWRRLVARRAGAALSVPPSVTPSVPPSVTLSEPSADPVAVPPSTPEPRDSGAPLAAADLRVTYGATVALDDVTFEVRPGEVLGVVGANGAGKSTLVDALTGFTTTGHGTVGIGNTGLSTDPPSRRVTHGVRRTFQHQRRDDRLSVRDYRRLHGPNIPEGHPWLTQWPADSAPLEVLHEAQVRLLQAETALLSATGFVLLDEPASGLDEHSRSRLRSRIAAAADRGVGVLVVEHDVAFLTEVCDQAIAMDQGRVIARGPVTEVLQDRHVMAAYLGEAG